MKKKVGKDVHFVALKFAHVTGFAILGHIISRASRFVVSSAHMSSVMLKEVNDTATAQFGTHFVLYIMYGKGAKEANVK